MDLSESQIVEVDFSQIQPQRPRSSSKMNSLPEERVKLSLISALTAVLNEELLSFLNLLHLSLRGSPHKFSMQIPFISSGSKINVLE